MNNKWYIAIAVAIAAIVVGWLLWGRDAGAPELTGSPTATPLGFTFTPTPTGGITVSPTPGPSGSPLAGNQWEGRLMASDNALRGNLKLVTKINNFDNVIYIRTARDFSALVDKEVIVTYDGTLGNFRLVNIVAK